MPSSNTSDDRKAGATVDSSADLPPELAPVRDLARALGPTLSDRSVVFGEGNPRARLMLVGEAPGEQEDRQRRPFVGRAGQLLTRALTAVGVDRSELWITNAVKQRPVVEASGRLANRPPRVSELRAWKPILDQEIAAVTPSAILCLGAPAAKVLIHPQFRIGAERGQWFDGPGGTRVSATFHPAYILRLDGEAHQSTFETFCQDLAAAWRLAHG